MSSGAAADATPPVRPLSRGDAGEAILHACRRLDARGLIAGAEGNVSARLDAEHVLVTPAGRIKGDLTAEELVVTDMDGRVEGGGRASSELLMHLRIYAERPDAGAVVHAHPPTATGFGVAGEDLLAPVLPEIILLVGGVPLVPFAPPGGDDLAEAVAPFVRAYDAVLLANHGLTTLGATVGEALQRMESVEQAARILLVARQLGRVRGLSPEQLRRVAPGQADRDFPPDPSSRIDA